MKGLFQRLRSDPAAVRLERLARLQGLTASLSAAATPEEVARIIFDRGLGLVGARAVTLFWERTPGALELVYGLGLSEEFAQRFRRLGPDAALPSAEAYRTGKPVWLGSPEAIARCFPEAARLVMEEGDVAWAAIPLVLDRSRGALELRFDAPRAFDAEERAFVMAVARQCAQALERARLYEAQKLLADRIASLQATTSALSAALTPREVAAVVFRQLLRLGASEGSIFYLATPDRLDLAFAHGADPDLLDRLARIPLDSPAPHTDAVRTGEVRWLETAEAIRAAYPALEPVRARRADGAWVAVPLRMEGRVGGALAISFPEARPLQEDDRSVVVALAEQCAQALERARLFEAQRRLAERLGQIHSIAAALSGAATPTGVAEAAFRGVAALGACSAEIHAVEGPERLALLARHGRAAPEPEHPLAIDAPAPAAEVVRTGKAIWLESPDEIEARFPNLEAERVARGEGAWAVVPLLAGGNALGSLSIAFGGPHAFEADEKAFVRMLAMPVAQALERSRLFEAAARHREQAEWTSATLDAMFAGAPVGLALLDREMRFLRMNAVLAGMNGIPPEAHLGKTPLDLMPGPLGAQLAAAFRRVIETGAPVEDVVMVGETPARPGETQRRTESWFPVRVGGAIVGVGVLVREQPAGDARAARAGTDGPGR